MTKPRLSVVIVTYQSAEDIGACLRSIEAHDFGVQAIVVDNGSTDDTIERAREALPAVQILTGQGNVGFARGCNLGARAATGDYILFLNPDTVLRPGALAALISAAEQDPAAGLWGGRTLRPDGRVEETCAFGLMTPWSLLCFATGLSSIFARNRLLDPESLGSWPRDTARTVPALSGACLMLSRSAWEGLGGFDERYFMYAEDADLSRRARKAGFRPSLVPAAQLVHSVGASSSPGTKQVMLHRGKATYVRLRWPFLTRRLGLGFLLAGVWLRARLSSLRPAGGDRRRTSQSAWSEAWRRRHEWIAGW